MRRAVSGMVMALTALTACESSTAPVGEGVFALEGVVGGALPWRVTSYSGRILLVADTVRLGPGDRYARATVLIEERDPPAADSTRAEPSGGVVLATDGGWTLVTDACRPDRGTLSLCIAPDTVRTSGSGLTVVSPLLGAELKYRMVR